MLTIAWMLVDRLQEAGFTAEEIADLRRQFAASRPDSHLETNPVLGLDDDGDDHARALEELWMEGMGNQEATESSPSSHQLCMLHWLTVVIYSAGEYMTLLKGVCLGFLFPLIPLLWFRGPTFSRRMQMGITAGLFVNVTFGVLRMLA